MAESTQHKLDRIRPPRVQITYDVETGDASESKELPFVVGIMADLSGQPENPLPKLKDRKFVEIDRDNFNSVLASLKPHLKFTVPNKLTGEGNLAVDLNFSHMDDFSPISLLKQVEPLRKLFEARQRLNDLIGKLDGNDELDALLHEVLQNTEGMQELKTATTAQEGGAPAEAEAPAEETAAE